MSTTNGSHGYDVSYPDPVVEQLNRWADLAGRVGQRSAYIDALREMRQRLVADPRNWGDPVRELRGMAATYYRRVGSVLIVTYAVHNTRPVVFVQRVWLTPGSQMAEAETDQSPN
jgi:hypothetical protein